MSDIIIIEAAPDVVVTVSNDTVTTEVIAVPEVNNVTIELYGIIQGGSGDVASVNTKTGVVVLNAADVGADPIGTATTAIATHNAAANHNTDVVQDALEAAANPSTSNPFVTTSELVATKYHPFSATVAAGTLVSGTVNDILTPNGGTTIRVDETNPGGLTVELEFHDVVEFNSISLRLQYAGGSSHIIQQQVWNKTTLAWDVLSEQIGPQAALTWMTNGIGNSDNYVDAGVAKIRLIHISPFNSSHYLLIDYASLVSSVGGSIIPIPTQTQAENVADVSGSPFLWPVNRLQQLIVANSPPVPWWEGVWFGPDPPALVTPEAWLVDKVGYWGVIDFPTPGVGTLVGVEMTMSVAALTGAGGELDGVGALTGVEMTMSTANLTGSGAETFPGFTVSQFDAANKSVNALLSAGDTVATLNVSGAWRSIRALMSPITANSVFKLSIANADANKGVGIGVGTSAVNLESYCGASTTGVMYTTVNGSMYYNGGASSPGLGAATGAHYITVYVEAATGKVWFGLNALPNIAGTHHAQIAGSLYFYASMIGGTPQPTATIATS